MSTLANFFNIKTSTDHNPELYYNSSINQCTYFREPKECIASKVYRSMAESENKGHPTSWNNFEDIDRLIIANVASYKKYITSAIENKNTLYIGNFEDIKINPYREIAKICIFFDTKIDQRWVYNLEEVKRSLYSKGLMTDPDGHMPRPKSDTRLGIETYVQQSSLFDEVSLMYDSLIYT
jgi:hypothetical protein